MRLDQSTKTLRSKINEACPLAGWPSWMCLSCEPVQTDRATPARF